MSTVILACVLITVLCTSLNLFTVRDFIVRNHGWRGRMACDAIVGACVGLMCAVLAEYAFDANTIVYITFPVIAVDAVVLAYASEHGW